MKIALSATQLERAATLTKQVETLGTELTKAQSVVDGLNQKINPLREELDSIMGYKAFKAPGGTGRFTPEQRAKISAGLKAKWAERKAAAATAAPVANGTPAPAKA
jgi:hypothetical protein